MGRPAKRSTGATTTAKLPWSRFPKRTSICDAQGLAKSAQVRHYKSMQASDFTQQLCLQSSVAKGGQVTWPWYH